MTNIEKNILKIKAKISSSIKKNGIPVTLVAISKAQPLEKIKAALSTGQREFGESYLQEALEKIKTLDRNQIIWHYIGRIQSRKTKPIAENFAWVQSISSYKQAELLNKYRPNNSPTLNVCIQVNISEETNKSGILINEILPLAKKIHDELPRLKLRGLMTIPAYTKNIEKQLTAFKRLKEEFENLKLHKLPVDTLSMGMSHDFEIAIEAGATMVRVGSAIFGER